MSTRINLIKIGWDLGGAHIKYCVESEASNTIWYDIIDFDFPQWHTTEDIVENCSPKGLFIVGNVLLNFIYDKGPFLRGLFFYSK